MLPAAELADADPRPVDAPTDRPSFGLNLAAWRLVAAGAVVIALACICGLVAIVALGDGKGADDALATLALTLAILAFIVQILVYMVQTSASHLAERRSEQLNSETRSVLADIGAKSDANLEILASQFQQLLDALLERAPVPTETTDGDGSDDVPPQDRDWASIAVSNSASPFTLRSDGWTRAQELSQPLNADEAKSVISVLMQLSPAAIALLERYRTRERLARLEGRPSGLIPSSSHDHVRSELTRHELLELVAGRYRLSALGEVAARAFVGDPDPEALQVLKQLRSTSTS